MIFFTADLHLCHDNIIRHCNRPFDNADSMYTNIACNWNSVVKRGDSVYILGDISLDSNVERSRAFIKSLNGNKFLIRGNHDKKISREKGLFSWVKDIYKLKVPDRDVPGGKRIIVLCHYAMRVWPLSHYGSWHLYGHSHGDLPPYGLSFDVGVDAWGFYPVSYEQVKEKMNKIVQEIQCQKQAVQSLK
jgi:calcineurin-like phosphoesterase family protein